MFSNNHVHKYVYLCALQRLSDKISARQSVYAHTFVLLHVFFFVNFKGHIKLKKIEITSDPATNICHRLCHSMAFLLNNKSRIIQIVEI